MQVVHHWNLYFTLSTSVLRDEIYWKNLLKFQDEGFPRNKAPGVTKISGKICSLHLLTRRMRKQILPKRWYLSTKLHDVTSQKAVTVELIAVSISYTVTCNWTNNYKNSVLLTTFRITFTPMPNFFQIYWELSNMKRVDKLLPSTHTIKTKVLHDKRREMKYEVWNWHTRWKCSHCKPCIVLSRMWRERIRTDKKKRNN
jgi:hypothetical protein